MDNVLRCHTQFRRGGQIQSSTLGLLASRTAFLLVDVYYDNQQRGDWGESDDPFVPQFHMLEQAISLALNAARRVGLSIIYTMNSAPRIAIQRSAFGVHFARSWDKDGSLHAFNHAFAEGGVDAREYHTGLQTPLKIPASLSPQAGDYNLRKHVYSAFFDSRLDTLLRNLRIETLVCGLTSVWLQLRLTRCTEIIKSSGCAMEHLRVSKQTTS
jgi:nicotinamidase-related amidase